MKRIQYESWLKLSGRPDERSRFILAHFDVPALKRGKKAPAVARGHRRKR